MVSGMYFIICFCFPKRMLCNIFKKKWSFNKGKSLAPIRRCAWIADFDFVSAGLYVDVGVSLSERWERQSSSERREIDTMLSSVALSIPVAIFKMKSTPRI